MAGEVQPEVLKEMREAMKRRGIHASPSAG
jgi:hypothetical protein